MRTRGCISRLSEVDLTAANLAGANLAGTTLFGADLAGANLAGAILVDAELEDASMAGADLRGADLRCADGDDVMENRYRALGDPLKHFEAHPDCRACLGLLAGSRRWLLLHDHEPDETFTIRFCGPAALCRRLCQTLDCTGKETR